jgi:hypothetical protein
MDSNDEPYKQRKISDSKFNFGDVFQSVRVRRSFQRGNDIDRFLLDYGYNFLPYIAIISWIIFFIVKY